ncbi:hypothetical protein [Mahella australiensis]|uniref:Binding-protein-dependent transport systems inner membrane component n=1 Tax=Mahella australiensis (strain DSM 15567 / CIP 107919 / 50-1 BON) TaxID=697281 RepID=F3ZX95_MAHA5|nr:hypothetical protein [Mahella australiensis]AEE96552.1 hypothetical protein Mahau_1358 [Mahella australiensis 50-1 BON]
MDNRKGNQTYAIVSFVILIVVLVVCAIGFTREIMLSMKVFEASKGFSGSPWVGMKNYNALFESIQFKAIMRNTIVFNLNFSAMVFIIAVIIGYIVTLVPKYYKETLVILCTLPVFIPADVYAGWFINLLGSHVFMNAGAMVFIHPLLAAVKYAGIPITLIYILDEVYADKDPLLPPKAAGLFSLASLAFIANSFFSLTNALYNPSTYETMDMLDTAVFRSGLLQANISTGAALGVIRTIISLLSAAVLFVPILYLFRATFRGERKKTIKERTSAKLVPVVIALIVFAAIYFLPYIIKGSSFDLSRFGGEVNLYSPIVIYLLLSAVSAFIAAVIAVLMSGAFVGHQRNMGLVAAILLAFITVLTAQPFTMHGYLSIKSMGMINTIYPFIFTTCFSVAAVWAMACRVNMENEISISDNTFLLSIAGIFLIQMAVTYINVTPALLYMNDRRYMLMSPVAIFRELQIGAQVGMEDAAQRASLSGSIGLYGFIVSLPPLLLFLVADVLLPREDMLAIISAGMKR